MTDRCVLAFALLFVLADCAHQPQPEQVVLSYSETAGMCINCPTFKIDFESEGEVSYECKSGCAVPGMQSYSVPKQRFTDLLQEFRKENFFAIPRTSSRFVDEDSAVFRLTYRDDQKIHEVVDSGRHNVALTRLEDGFRSAVDAERFRKSSVDLYRKLVKSGWKVNTVATDQQNALTFAASRSDLESARFLVAQGSAITPAAIGNAAMNGNLAIFQLVMPASAIQANSQRAGDFAFAAARPRDPAVLRYLLDAGVSPNQRDAASGRTLLLNATSNGQMETAALLMDHGADPNAFDMSGRSALWYAANAYDTGFIQLLVQHGAYVNAADNQGTTALMNAASGCYYWDMEALLKAGADPTLKNKQGKKAADLIDAPGPNCEAARKLLR